MARKKAPQKNTLALWAGAKVDEPDTSHVLILKVDAAKLRSSLYASSGSLPSITDSLECGQDIADDASVSFHSSTSEASTVCSIEKKETASRPIVAPHPFFEKPKKQIGGSILRSTSS